MGIFNIVLPNSSIVYHRFMGQEIWCISFLKQGIARILLVCEDVVNCAPMPSVSTSRSRSFLLSKNNSKLNRFIEALARCEGVMEFTEQDWGDLVECVVVKPDTLTFEFKDNSKIEVAIQP